MLSESEISKRRCEVLEDCQRPRKVSGYLRVLLSAALRQLSLSVLTEVVNVLYKFV